MITDALCQLSGAITGGVVSGQALTGAAAVLSTNVYDLGVARDIGKGEQLELVFETIVAPAGATALTFQLVEADTPDMATNLNVILQTDAYPVGTLPAGTQIPLHLDRVDPYAARRYLAARYVPTGALTAGSFFATIVKSIADKQTNYSSGFAVL